MKLPNHTSLKEWASAIEALGRGDQVILIRKGGIADPTFGVEAERFYLFPTYFHQPAPASASGVAITHWCEVVRSWRVRDLAVLHALEPFVIFSRQALEERYHFRADQALHILGVRVWRLPSPASVASKPAYAGCRSWVSIDEEIDTEGSVRVMPDDELNRKLDAIGAVMAGSETQVASA